MGDPVVLQTARLILSRPDEADIDAIFAYCQDPLVQAYTTVPSPYTREDAVTFVALVEEWWQSGAELVWGIRDDEGLAGTIALHRIANRGAEIGWALAPQARGRGYMTEAVRAVLDFAFGPLRLERVEWQAMVGNHASAAVAQRVGFQYEGLRRKAQHLRGTRHDGWLAGILATDARTPQAWPI